MKLAAFASLAIAAPAHALIRFGCAQLVVQRLDPLVNPGMNPSAHLHQIIGGVSSLKYLEREELLTIRTHLMKQ